MEETSILNYVVEGNFSSRDLAESEFFAKANDLIFLQKLFLNKTNLKTLPSEIGIIKSLEYLSIKENNLFDLKIDFTPLKNLKQLICAKNLLSEKSIPESFYDCEWIVVLDFEHNAFKSIPSKLNLLSNLTCLNMSKNSNLKIEPEHFQRNKSLANLYVNDCNLKHIPDKMHSFTCLESLDLHNNPLCDSDLRKIGSIKSLKTLNMRNTRRNENNIKDSLSKLKNIEEFDFSFNNFTILPDSLCTFSSIKILNVSNNKIKKVSSLIDCLFRIEILDLSGNCIEYLPEQINHLPKLRKLFLNANNLTYEGMPKSFDDLISLEILNLSLNPIQTLPDSLVRCSNLKKLYVEFNDMTSFPDFSSNPNIDIQCKGNEYVQKLFRSKKKESQLKLEANFDLKANLQKAGITNIDVESDQEEMNKKAFEEIQNRLIESKKSKALSFLQSINVKSVAEEKKTTDEKLNVIESKEKEEQENDIYPSFDERKQINQSEDFKYLKDMDDGLVVWYIDNFTPVLLSEDLYGKFFSQEAYIVLYCNSDTGTKTVFSWIGPEAPIDKKISAPLVALTLKNSVEIASPVKNENCFEESAEFLTAFNFNIDHTDGLISETVIKANNKKEVNCGKLYQILLPNNKFMAYPVSSKSRMPIKASKSIFLIVTTKDFILWIGKNVPKIAKVKLMHFIGEWNHFDFNNKSSVTFAEQTQHDSEEMTFFLSEKAKIPKEEFYFDSISDDDQSTLYEVKIDEKNKSGIIFTIINTSSGYHSKTDLKSDRVYLLDTPIDIFIWQGLKSNYPTKIAAARLADELIQIYQRPDYFESYFIFENSENYLFTQNFADWSRLSDKVEGKNVKKRVVQIDASDLFMPKKNLRNAKDYETLMIEMNECLKNMQIYAFSKQKGHYVPYPEIYTNSFFDESTYFVICSLEIIEDDQIVPKFICFTWKGRKSNNQGLLAFNLEWKTQLVSKFKDEIDFQNLTQQNESDFFLSLFSRKFCVIKGHWEDEFESFDAKMFQLRSGGDYLCLRCIEIDCLTKNLNSSFVTIVIQKNNENSVVHCWKGMYATQADFKDAQEIAFNLVDIFFSENEDPEIGKIFESQEPSKFWKAFSEIEEYSHFAPYEGQCRLFKVNFDQHALTLKIVEECSDFNRSTLDNDTAFILDDGSNLFIYIDLAKCGKEKTELAQKTASLYSKYIKTIDDNASRNKPEIIAKDKEPTRFTQIFHGW